MFNSSVADNTYLVMAVHMCNRRLFLLRLFLFCTTPIFLFVYLTIFEVLCWQPMRCRPTIIYIVQVSFTQHIIKTNSMLTSSLRNRALMCWHVSMEYSWESYQF